MENNKKDEWLQEEFGIKVNNRYLCIQKNGKAIRGQILNFCPSKNIVIKAEDGLHILPYSEILELRPLPVKEEKFKVGDIVRVKENINGYGFNPNIIDKIQVNKGSILIIAQIQEDIATKKPVIRLGNSNEYLMISLYNPKLELIKRGIV